jgi:Clostripain family
MAMPAKADWTVLTYIAAHNNLEQFGKASLMEILNVGSTSGAVLGALYDGAAGAVRCVVGDPGYAEEQEQLGGFDAGDPDQLIATAKWLFKRHPAEHYGLVLWSHGTGWQPGEIEAVSQEARLGTQTDPGEAIMRSLTPGRRALFRTTLRSLLRPDKAVERAILFDDGTAHSLDTLELARVASTIAESVGQPIELLGMDACLMASLEVAYELRGTVRHLVASEELVPAHSWPYPRIYGALRDSPDQGGADLARLVVDRYTAHYRTKPPAGGDVTQIALDLTRVAEVAQKLDTLAAAMLPGIDTAANALWTAQTKTRKRETRHDARQDHKFNYHLWDLGTLARELAAETQDPAVAAAARGLLDALAPGAAVLAEGHVGEWFDGLAGVSVYLVQPPTRISPAYARLSLTKDTAWGRLLAAYHRVYT